MKKKKKVVITYGTFDMFHIGHLNILKRAKSLGDYLIVGVTSEDYDRSRGKLNVSEGTKKRLKTIQKLDFVDKVIIENHKDQKIEDIKKYNVDIFAIGDDWKGKFDYLKDYCKVVYLPRTEGISSTMLRSECLRKVKLGIIGTGRIAHRFVKESRFIKNVEVDAVMSRNLDNVKKFITKHKIDYGFDNIDDLLNSNIEAVYIASPHEYHYEQAKKSILKRKHVLCEKPITLKHKELKELIELSKENNVILLEAIKTSYFPAFNKVLEEIKKGIIGEVKEVRSTFTKLINNRNSREWTYPYGGATNELASYPLLLAQRILGKPSEVNFYDQIENNVDLSNRIVCRYDSGAISISTVGIGSKAEGSAVISGTKGYIYIPAPWWLTKEFFIRFEDPSKEYKYSYDLDGDGIRYEISEFIMRILRHKKKSPRLPMKDIIEINKIISNYNKIRFKKLLEN